MKKFSKQRFSKEKLAKFFDKEGFYIVLFLCVCIVAITAVWVSRSGVKETPQQNTSQVQDNQTTGTPPSAETSSSNETEKTAQNGSNPAQSQNSASSGSKISANTTAASTPAKTVSAPSSFKIGDPMKDGISKENIFRDYSPEEPVCFEYPNFEWRTHDGIDVKCTKGADVLAAADGKIIEVKDDNENPGGLGWTIVIDHNNGYRTVYSNLEEPKDLSKNQNVKKGQKIGVIGSTSIYEMDSAAASVGEPVESHLHFEVLKVGTDKVYSDVDPKQYLSLQN